MIRKEDPASRWLTAHFKAMKQVAASLAGQREIEILQSLNPGSVWNASQFDWDKPAIRDAWAASVLTLAPNSEFDGPLADAFTAAGLDPKNPFHWRLLISVFALAHFRKRRERGRPEEWSDKRYCQLLQDVAQLKKRHPNLSNKRACEILCKKGHYKTKSGNSLSGARLRKALNEARDPSINSLLALRVNETLQASRSDYQRRGLEWSSETESDQTKRAIDASCASISRG